jgi:hypothetical protein
MSPERGGVVFLVHRSAGSGPESDDRAWSGYWERVDPPGMLAEGEWDSAADAIAWGRERTDEIVLRVDLPGRQYFAGPPHADRQGLIAWPPEDADRFDP